MLPGCIQDTLFLNKGDTAPVGCYVCTFWDSMVDLNCTASAGTEPISYMWVDSNGAVVSNEPILSVSMEGEYNCTASNADLLRGVMLTTNVLREFFYF